MRLSNIIERKTDILSHINPQRIYVENVRSFFNLNYRVAKFFCEMAVKQRYLRKRYGVICPNEDCHRLITSYSSKAEIPKMIKCEVCEQLERDRFEFYITPKDIMEVYQLTEKK